VAARIGRGLRRGDEDLPGLHPARAGEREHGAAVDPPRLEPNPRIADLGCSDEVVERDPVGLRQGKEHLEARTPLPGLEPREGALRDAGGGGQAGEGDAALLAQALESGTDPVEGIRDATVSVSHGAIVAGTSRKPQHSLCSPGHDCTLNP
jgi:hypothetical protein